VSTPFASPEETLDHADASDDLEEAEAESVGNSDMV
jgi:hypothetical protein